MLAGRQPLAHFMRHRDVVTSHALSFTNDHFEIERDALANAPNLDHGDLSVVDIIRRPQALRKQPTSARVRVQVSMIEYTSLRQVTAKSGGYDTPMPPRP